MSGPVLGPRNIVKYKQMNPPPFNGSYTLLKGGEMTVTLRLWRAMANRSFDSAQNIA